VSCRVVKLIRVHWDSVLGKKLVRNRGKKWVNTTVTVRRSKLRVIGDYGGYRRLIAYLVVFGREVDA
jgi:hypothetical protein